jgi:hypothetical protein
MALILAEEGSHKQISSVLSKPYLRVEEAEEGDNDVTRL